MRIVFSRRLAPFVAAAALVASACAAPEGAEPEPTSASTAALEGASLVLAPAELTAPPGSPRQLQASLALDAQTPPAPVYFWADAPAGVSIQADAWPSAGGVGNLHVLVDESVGDGDYQALVHGWRDGQTFDAPLLLHVRRLGELAVLVDPALEPARAQLPSYPDGEPRPVARFVDERGQGADFVADELIVTASDPAALDALLARTGGHIVDAMYPGQYQLAGVAPTYLVRVDPARADTGRLLEDLRALDARPRGQHRVSSAAGLGLVALGAREAAASGLSVGINWLPESQGFVDRALTDGPAAKDKDGNPLTWSYTPNAFTWPHFARGSVQDIGVAEAWGGGAGAAKLGPNV
jgi:hypothetical protein